MSKFTRAILPSKNVIKRNVSRIGQLTVNSQNTIMCKWCLGVKTNFMLNKIKVTFGVKVGVELGFRPQKLLIIRFTNPHFSLIGPIRFSVCVFKISNIEF